MRVICNQNLPAQCETGWPKILLEVQDPRGPKMRVFECPRFSYTRFEPSYHVTGHVTSCRKQVLSGLRFGREIFDQCKCGQPPSRK